jgi:hypothetical protein
MSSWDNGYDPEATRILPVVPPDATVVLPSAGTTQPIQVPRSIPEYGGRHTAEPTTYLGNGVYQSETAYLGPGAPGAPGVSDSAAPGSGAEATQVVAESSGGPETTGMQSLAKNSATMAVFSIVSRVTGFVRTAIIGAAIGGALVADDSWSTSCSSAACCPA